MTPYWVTFKTHNPVCIEAGTRDEAAMLANKLDDVILVEYLPYPADPRYGEQTKCPPFCYTPNYCAGRNCCPKEYACSE